MISSALIRKIFDDRLINAFKALYNKDLKEEKRICELPRFTIGSSRILDYYFDFPDAASFISMREEIWHKQSYFFKSKNQRPYILDCGSNIGLSVVFFKHLYPESRIIAFEPDPKILRFLKVNLAQNRCDDVEVIPKAVWEKNGNLFFASDGADGGKVVSAENGKSVEGTHLASFIDEEVDLLKLDVEGNELRILHSCKEKLFWVKNLFIEYHSFKDNPQELSQILCILEQEGFRYRLDSASPLRRPFVSVSEGEMDLQLNIYASKIKAN